MKSIDLILQTTDNVSIAGKYILGSLPFGVIFLHQMPSDKESYNRLAEKLSVAGFHTLAIDFRGHGQSGGGDYHQFSEFDHQKYSLDLLAAYEYLQKQYPDVRVGLIGSSIGANVALTNVENLNAKFVVALSAGLNYYGVDAAGAVKILSENLPIYFISAEDDSRVQENSKMSTQLFEFCRSLNKNIKIFPIGGHGTEILDNHQDFEDQLCTWILNLLK